MHNCNCWKTKQCFKKLVPLILYFNLPCYWHVFETLLGGHISSIIKGLIHPQMVDVSKLSNDIEMNGSHLSIVEFYFSTQSVLL
jgi:hypothetical protein